MEHGEVILRSRSRGGEIHKARVFIMLIQKHNRRRCDEGIGRVALGWIDWKV